jgi:hypothetical protein
MNNLGILKGETCNRNGCDGIINEHPKEGGCSCHINPPCSYCTTSTEYCPKCGWDGKDEQDNYIKNMPKQKEWEYKIRTVEDLDKTKISWIIEGHTHFSMKCIGVYPKEATRDDVLKQVRGTFGGRFTYFENGKFTYIAYTD